MILLNKVVLSTYNFNAGISLMFYQNLISTVIVVALSICGIVSVEKLSWKLIKVWLPVNIIFVGMLVSGMYSLKFINIAMVTILKNVTNILTAIGEYYLFRRRQNQKVWTAMFLMIISAISGGITDLAFNTTGYAWQFINCILTASYSNNVRAVGTHTLGRKNAVLAFKEMGPEATPYKLMEKSKKDKHGNWVHPRAAEIDLGYQRLMSQPMPQGQEPDDFESYYTASGGYNDKNCVWGIGSAAPELFEPPANRTTRHSVSSYSPTMYSQVATENKLLKNRLSRMDMELIYQRRKGESMEAFLSKRFGWTPPPDPRCSRGPLPSPRDDDFTDDGHPFGSRPVC